MASPPFFSTVTSFEQVPKDNGVETDSFLKASEGLVKMFDLLGNPAFKVVQNDLTGNINKIRERYLAAPDRSATLEALVENECKESGGTNSKKKATQGLLWLLRGLSFTAKALRRSVTNTSEELSVSFTKAYEETLRKFHSIVIRPVFSLAMKACPYRATFYEKLNGGSTQPEAQALTMQALHSWLGALEAITSKVDNFYNAGNYGKGL